MATRMITGTVTALGPHYARNDGDIYTHIEITAPDGCRISIAKVVVGSETRSAVQLDVAGEFFLDRVFFVTGALRWHLWGLKARNVATFDRKHLGSVAGSMHVALGLLLSPLMGLGVPLVALGLFQWLSIPRWKLARRRLFYGDDPSGAADVRHQEAVRI